MSDESTSDGFQLPQLSAESLAKIDAAKESYTQPDFFDEYEDAKYSDNEYDLDYKADIELQIPHYDDDDDDYPDIEEYPEGIIAEQPLRSEILDKILDDGEGFDEYYEDDDYENFSDAFDEDYDIHSQPDMEQDAGRLETDFSDSLNSSEPLEDDSNEAFDYLDLNDDDIPKYEEDTLIEEEFDGNSFDSNFMTGLSRKSIDESKPEDSENEQDGSSLKEKILAKFNETLSQIKAELRGEGDDNYTPKEKSEPRSKGAPRDSKMGNLFTKVTNPLLKLLFLPLGLLAKLPVIGGFFRGLMNPNWITRTLSIILPLFLISLGLYIHGNQALLPPKKLTFPDGGAATFSELSYDRKTGVASGIVTNTGEVNAEVSPRFIIHSIQPSLNPLSLFYPKENKPCDVDFVEVPIGEKKKVSAKCKISGFDRKITGELKW